MMANCRRCGAPMIPGLTRGLALLLKPVDIATGEIISDRSHKRDQYDTTAESECCPKCGLLIVNRRTTKMTRTSLRFRGFGRIY